MGHTRRWCVLVVHNQDFEKDVATDEAEWASRADVESAARDVATALSERGHAVHQLALPRDPREALALLVGALHEPPTLLFNLCESLASESRHEALPPALFELCGVAYTGSGPRALAVALRKDWTKAVLRAHDLPTPEGFVSVEGELPEHLPPFPLIVKPVREDASTGIWLRSVVTDRAQLAERVEEVRRRYRQPALVERFIAGREVYVSLLGNDDELVSLPPHEIDFSEMPVGAPHVVTYDAKWNSASAEYRGTRSVRAVLSAAEAARCAAVARAAFFALELADYARIDLRLSADGVPYIIDVNPNCDLSAGAGVARAASFARLSYPELIDRIAGAAERRHGQPALDTPELRDEITRRATLHAIHSRQPVAGSIVQPARPAADPPTGSAGSRTAGGAVDPGRALHGRGGLGRARAHRQRAR